MFILISWETTISQNDVYTSWETTISQNDVYTSWETIFLSSIYTLYLPNFRKLFENSTYFWGQNSMKYINFYVKNDPNFRIKARKIYFFSIFCVTFT